MRPIKLHTSLLLTSHWPEQNHMATSTHKEAGESELLQSRDVSYLSVQHVTDTV